jgi:hypothetical protein
LAFLRPGSCLNAESGNEAGLSQRAEKVEEGVVSGLVVDEAE